jgi:TolB-like protein/DNA-binding SARP family transcriptional activator
MHRFRLFGGASLEGTAGPVTGRAAQRGRLALLTLLALEHPRPLSRDKLSACLWPESDTERARHQLRDSLYVLRAALGEDALLAPGDELRLDPERLSCDLWEFREALERGDTATAVALYGGPFLDGAYLNRAEEFERWVDAERTQLAHHYAEALESLAEESEAAGELLPAAGRWRRLAEHDPYNSRYALRLMQALESAGDRAGALRHAEVHAALLQAEFGVEPAPELATFAARLRAETSPPEEPAAAEARLSAPGEPPGARAPPEPVESPAPAPDAARATAVAVVAPAAPGAARSRSFVNRQVAWRWRWQSGLAGVLLLWTLGAVAAGERGQDVLAALRMWTGASLPLRVAVAAEEAPIDRSLAVLPFTNLSLDEENEYFSDGITEEIIALLAKIGELRVTSRTSIMRYKATEKSLPEIARELGVAHILEGSVRRSGGRLRITAQLIDSHSDAHLWAESYDRELTAETLFQIQSDIAQQIAAALRAEITPAERQRLERPATTDLAAYDLYLRARDEMKPHRVEGYRWAISLFDRALQRDARFVLAEAHRGEAYGLLWTRTRREEYRDSALASHQRVLRMQPDLPEGHQLLGRHQLSIGRLREALLLNQRALELDPNHPGALLDLATIHWLQGRLDQALTLARSAAALEPTNGLHSWLVFMTYVRLGDLESADRWYRPLLDVEASPLRRDSREMREHVYRAVLSLMRGQRGPVLHHLDVLDRLGAENPPVISFLSTTALHAGDLEAARGYYERQQAAFPHRWRFYLTGLAYTYRAAGERQRADALLDEALQRAGQALAEGDETAEPHVILAQVHAIRGERDRALQHLEAAHARGWRDYYYARLDPRYETLRGDPRFERLMGTIKADLDGMRARVREVEGENPP